MIYRLNCLIFCCLLIFYEVSSQGINFDHLTTQEGLSQNTVNCIFKDSEGFIWIGTNDGLNRYDGYNFKVYRHNYKDTTTLSDNKIYAIIEDDKSNLWIGTRSGLNVYIRDYDHFVRYVNKPGDPNSISHNFVRSIYKDQQSQIWIGTLGGGINKFIGENYNEGKFYRFRPECVTDSLKNYSVSNITSIYQDGENEYWLGTHWGGLIRFLSDKNKFIFYPYNKSLLKDNFGKTIFKDSEGDIFLCTEGNGFFIYNHKEHLFKHYKSKKNTNSISNNIIKDIYEDENKNFWIATDGGGLNLFNKSKGIFRQYLYNINNNGSLSSNGVYCIYKDNQNIYWIGTFGGGVNIYNKNRKKFYHYTQEIGSPNSLSHKSVLAFNEDHNGKIWIGTDGGGLNLFNREKGTFRHFKADPSDPNSLSSNVVTTIYEDHEHHLWIGTYSGGLSLFDTKNNRFYSYQKDPDHPERIINNNIWDILEDSKGRFWIGTSSGLMQFNRDKEEFSYIETASKNNNLFLERVVVLFEDHNGTIWTGGAHLNYLDEVAQKLVPFQLDNDDFWSKYDIRSITEDEKNNLWVGTEGGGLIQIAPDRKSYHKYGVDNGLPNDAIHQVLIDDNNNLWISTNEGISKYNPETSTFRNYDINDGLQSNQFSYSAAMKSKTGEMFFGGINGFNIFHPDSIEDNMNIPSVVFTNFLISNKPVPIDPKGKESPLKKHINEVDSIILSYDQAFITFEFTALNYTASQKNLYACYLEGFEEEWNEIGNRRTATYTNLDPGEYFFHVKAANNDGKWNNEGTSVYLKVLPPFWKTTWAYLIYSAIFLSVVWSFRKYLLDKAQFKHDIKVQELEKDKIKKVNQMKLNFFTNISHEFRTPLTLILNPLENLISNHQLDETIREQLILMYRNGKRLMHLINQLMDFRKLDKEPLDLSLDKLDIVSFLKELKHAFDDFAEQHKVNYTFISSYNALNGWFDKDKLEKIFYNLLSNAFKFTPDEGTIVIKLTVIQKNDNQQERKFKYLRVMVEDNGIGIPAERLPKIFDRFYKISNAEKLRKKLEQESSGIGLSFTKELVEIHHGLINVKSEVGRGSCFIVELPLDKSVYHEHELKPSNAGSEESDIDEFIFSEKEDSFILPKVEGKQAPCNDKINVLLVEDNEDLLYFLKTFLTKEYHVLEAKNGKEGFELAKKSVPDLIITDVMMPVMNGYELCRKLKTDHLTCHIPVIILTAKNSIDSNILGYELGADDFIPKPFYVKMLTTRIKNLIENRRKLRERFRQQFLQPQEVKIASADDSFLIKALRIVEDHISDSEFDVNQFALEMGLSRSVFYRKMRAIADQSANEFINNIRLKRAAQLLKQNKLTISEITYEVGFNDPQYFSKCFKKQFGKTPSEFANQDIDYSKIM